MHLSVFHVHSNIIHIQNNIYRYRQNVDTMEQHSLSEPWITDCKEGTVNVDTVKIQPRLTR